MVAPASILDDPDQTSRLRRRLPAAWGAWALLLIATAGHAFFAVNNLARGSHLTLPAFSQVSGLSAWDWLIWYARLFVKPETTVTTIRLAALWALVLLVLCVYTSILAGMRLPHGIGSFIGHGLATLLILAVATPAVWWLLGAWGPIAVELLMPLVPAAVCFAVMRTAHLIRN